MDLPALPDRALVVVASFLHVRALQRTQHTCRRLLRRARRPFVARQAFRRCGNCGLKFSSATNRPGACRYHPDAALREVHDSQDGVTFARLCCDDNYFVYDQDPDPEAVAALRALPGCCVEAHYAAPAGAPADGFAVGDAVEVCVMQRVFRRRAPGRDDISLPQTTWVEGMVSKVLPLTYENTRWVSMYEIYGSTEYNAERDDYGQGYSVETELGKVGAVRGFRVRRRPGL